MNGLTELPDRERQGTGTKTSHRQGPTGESAKPPDDENQKDSTDKKRTGMVGMGVDHVSLQEIEANPRKYQYPLWNRLANLYLHEVYRVYFLCMNTVNYYHGSPTKK